MLVNPVQLLAPNRVRGRMQAVSTIAFNVVAGGLGPFLVGLTTDGLFHDESLVGHSLVLVCTVSIALGIVLIQLARRALAGVTA